MKVILNTEDIAKAREKFQNYWLSKSIQFERSLLQKAIDLLEDYMQLFRSGNCRLKSNIETKSIYTFFPHLGKTPLDNIKINPFINALNHF